MSSDAPSDDGLRVLLIDDDLELREHLVAAADPSRFRVAVAEGAPAAIQLMKHQRFDLVVCGLAGTLTQLHEHVARRGTNVIVFARDPPAMGGRGPFHVVRRPTTAAGLREALLAVVARCA